MIINKKTKELRKRVLADPNNLYISIGGQSISNSTNPVYESIFNRINYIFINVHKVLYDRILVESELKVIIDEISTELDILSILCDVNLLYMIDNSIISRIDEYIEFCEENEMYEIAHNLNKIIVFLR